jgi:hypothetical protein
MPLNIVKDVKEFAPHIAACSHTLNDGAANNRNIDLIQKSKVKSDKEVALLKILGEDSPETIEKASVRNTESMLRAALKEKYEDDDDYRWIWLEDFDPEAMTAVFEMEGKSYAVGYTVSANGLIELADDYQEVISHKVYTTADENNLILKSKEDAIENKDSEISSEEIVIEGEQSTSEDNLEEKEEETMSEKKDTPVEFSKAQLNQIEELLKAKEAETLARIEAENLLKSTTETLSGLEMVESGDVEVLAKGIVANQELGEVFVKSLANAQELIKSAKAEAEEVRKELGSHEQITDESEVKELEKGTDTASALKAQMAKLNA